MAAEIRFSQQVNIIVGYALEEAMRTGSFIIGPDHLMLGILRHDDNDACAMMRECGIDTADMKSALDAVLFQENSVPYTQEDEISLSPEAQEILNIAAKEAHDEGMNEVNVIHLLCAIAGVNCVSTGYLLAGGVNRDSFRQCRKRNRAPRVFHITVGKSKVFS